MKPTVFMGNLSAEDLREAMHATGQADATNRVSVEDTDSVSIERAPDGQLIARLGQRESTVWVRRCFPWSEPLRFVSLRNDDDEEFALVAEPSALDDDSRYALEEALVEAGFVLEITSLLQIDEEIEIRNWRVRTRQGERCFQTKLEDWPREVPGGGLLINDVAGDLYHVPAPSALDAKSRKLLGAYVD